MNDNERKQGYYWIKDNKRLKVIEWCGNYALTLGNVVPLSGYQIEDWEWLDLIEPPE